MTKPNIEQIRQRVEAATPGPWKMSNYRPLYVIQRNPNESTYEIGDNEFKPIICTQEPGDSKFIAHARTDIPALLAYIETLEAENREMKQWIKGTVSNFIVFGATPKCVGES